MISTLAKLKAVYGDTSAGGGAGSGAGSASRSTKKNYLGSEKMTLGGSAWGK
jgi:hypothetical protein